MDKMKLYVGDTECSGYATSERVTINEETGLRFYMNEKKLKLLEKITRSEIFSIANEIEQLDNTTVNFLNAVFANDYAAAKKLKAEIPDRYASDALIHSVFMRVYDEKTRIHDLLL
jgi:hypothetical protein